MRLLIIFFLFNGKLFILTVLSFFHLCIFPKIPDVTDNSPSDGGWNLKRKLIYLIMNSSKNWNS